MYVPKLLFKYEKNHLSQVAEVNRAKSLPSISNARFQKFAIAKKDENHFERTMRRILKVRIPGTEGSQQVRQVKHLSEENIN